MATISNLYIDQGTSFSATINLTNGDGTAIDLTDYTVKSQFRKSYQSSTAVDFTVTICNAVEGQICLELDPEDSSAIRAGRYLYDIEITDTDNKKIRVLEGLVIITPEITQS